MKKSERKALFQKYGGKCAYCGCDLPNRWHADHIQPIERNSKWSRGKRKFIQDGTCKNPHLETTGNYNPSCPSCNIQKNSFSVEEFRWNIKNFVNSLNLYSTQYKFAKKYGLLKETGIDVEFYFEKFNREES